VDREGKNTKEYEMDDKDKKILEKKDKGQENNDYGNIDNVYIVTLNMHGGAQL